MGSGAVVRIRPPDPGYVYLRTCVAQNSAKASGLRGGRVWCGLTPSHSGVKQKVTVTSNGSSARI